MGRLCTAVTLLFLLAGCRHGIEIVGSGSVASQSQTRNCAAAESPCRFTVTGAYQETYTANPATGWLHDAWESCQEPSGNQCRFNIAADVVADFEGAEIPSAVARFRRPIEPLFRDGTGALQLPAGNAPDQARWVLEQLRRPQTTIDEIRERFAAAFLQQFPANQIQQTIQTLRELASDPEVSDLILVTPLQVSAIVHNRNSNGPGFSLFVEAGYTSGSLITGFAVNTGFPRNGTSVQQADTDRNFQEIDAVLATLASDTSMYIGRIENDQCSAIYQRNSTEPLLPASIYKLWVLGALGEGIEAGRISPNEMLPLRADDIVANGSLIDNEALGTQVSLRDMANLMMGISDNTATDHMARRVGRDRIEQALPRFGHRNRDLITPFLTANEVRHLWFSVPAETVTRYLSGTEEEQRAIVDNDLAPRGSFQSAAFNNFAQGASASWTASAQDVCRGYAGLRRFNNRSAAYDIVDNAAGASAVFLGARNRWDRVWSKGGSLGTNQGQFVFTLSWLLESDNRGAFVIVLMANNPDLTPIESTQRTFSLAARAERLLDERF